MFKPIRFTTENEDPAAVVPPVVKPAAVPPTLDDPDLEKDEVIGDTADIQAEPDAEVANAVDEVQEVVEDIDDHVETINEVEARQEVIRGALESAEYTDASVRAASDVLRVLEESEFPVDRVAVECDPSDKDRYQHMLALEASESYLEFVGNSLKQLLSVRWEATIDNFAMAFQKNTANLEMFKARLDDVRKRFAENRKNIDANVLDVRISANYFWVFCSRDNTLQTDFVREFRTDSRMSEALLNGFVKDRRADIKSLARIIANTKIENDVDVVKAAKNLTSTIKPISKSDVAQNTGYEALLGDGRLFLRQGKPVSFSTTQVGTPDMIELSRPMRLTETRTVGQWFLDLFRRGQSKDTFSNGQILVAEVVAALIRQIKPIEAGDIPKLLDSADTYYNGMVGYRKNVDGMKAEIADLKRAIDHAPQYQKAADARAYYKTISTLVTTLTTACVHPGSDEYYRAMSGLRSAYYVSKLVVDRAVKAANKKA